MVFNQTNFTTQNLSVSTGFHLRYGKFHLILTLFILETFIIMTIVGNILVILAVLLERNLRNLSNYLILSMAVTDLIVALFVMNLSAINEISARWFLGIGWCDFWIFTDVLSCSASIFHLVTIAIDRYWSVTKIQYRHSKTMLHLIFTVISIWIISILIAIPSRFHFHRQKELMFNEVIIKGKCLINGGYFYTLISTFIAFYAPMVFMMIIYWKIYQVAKRQIRRKRKLNYPISLNSKCKAICNYFHCCERSDDFEYSTNGEQYLITSSTKSKWNYSVEDETFSDFKYADNISVNSLNSEIKYKLNLKDVHIARMSSMSSLRTINVAIKPHNLTRNLDEQKRKLEIQRERKAIVTVGIITCCFILCWMPFFTLALVLPFCGNNCTIHPIISSVLLWLGYLNCLLNPFIYTFFSQEFRSAFKNILTGHYWTRCIDL